MKVRELIAELYKCEQDDLVVIGHSGSGNSRSIYRVEEMCFESEPPIDMCLKLRELTEDLVQQGYSEEDVGKGKNCVVIWPN